MWDPRVPWNLHTKFKGVTRTIGTWDPCVPQNLHTKFHLSRFSSSVGRVSNDLCVDKRDRQRGGKTDCSLLIGSNWLLLVLGFCLRCLFNGCAFVLRHVYAYPLLGRGWGCGHVYVCV